MLSEHAADAAGICNWHFTSLQIRAGKCRGIAELLSLAVMLQLGSGRWQFPEACNVYRISQRWLEPSQYFVSGSGMIYTQ